MSACLDCGGSECICRSIHEHKALDRIVKAAVEAAHGEGDSDWEWIKEVLRREGLLRWWDDLCDAYERETA
jgi:hypothetical protein